MFKELGVNFAPTGSSQSGGGAQARQEGVPQAIKILSLRYPRVLGAAAPTSNALLSAKGAQGVDPFMGAVMQTLMQTIAPQEMTAALASPALSAPSPAASAPAVSAPSAPEAAPMADAPAPDSAPAPVPSLGAPSVPQNAAAPAPLDLPSPSDPPKISALSLPKPFGGGIPPTNAGPGPQRPQGGPPPSVPRAPEPESWTPPPAPRIPPVEPPPQMPPPELPPEIPSFIPAPRISLSEDYVARRGMAPIGERLEPIGPQDSGNDAGSFMDALNAFVTLMGRRGRV